MAWAVHRHNTMVGHLAVATVHMCVQGHALSLFVYPCSCVVGWSVFPASERLAPRPPCPPFLGISLADAPQGAEAANLEQDVDIISISSRD